MKIYTKFGDRGDTHLVGGQCVQKNNPRVVCYGTVDELNSCLGLAMATLKEDLLKTELRKIQNELFNLGSLLACENKETLPKLPKIEAANIEFFEKRIDFMSEILPPLKNFILPGGSQTSAFLHLARTVCRRAEREVVGLLQNLQGLQGFQDHDETLKCCLIYLNRLSDYLFVAARFFNHSAGVADEVWKK